MFFLEIKSRQFQTPYYKEVANTMELVLKSRTSESRSWNPVQLRARVMEISQGSEAGRHFSQFQSNSGGKSIN